MTPPFAVLAAYLDITDIQTLRAECKNAAQISAQLSATQDL